MNDALPGIRPASTTVLWRDGRDGPQVLMGQRGVGAAFMPSKFVFPGGGVDPGDFAPQSMVAPECLARLGQSCPPGAPTPPELIGAAVRELAEEAGLTFRPDARLRFIFRAITPPGRTRRFDARFFLVPASSLQGDAEDFSRASGELGHLHWIDVPAARGLDLPFITEIVIAEVAALVVGHSQNGVPFFDNSGSVPTFRRIS